MICYADFKHSRTGTNDAERSGHPVVPENTKKLHKLVLADRKLKLHLIAEQLKISEGSVFTILLEHLLVRSECRVCSQSIKTNDASTIQSIVCKCFNTTKMNSCVNVTMDEKWIHHFTPELNQLSAEWTAAGESRPKRPKTQTLTGRVSPPYFGSNKSD